MPQYAIRVTSDRADATHPQESLQHARASMLAWMRPSLGPTYAANHCASILRDGEVIERMESHGPHRVPLHITHTVTLTEDAPTD